MTGGLLLVLAAVGTFVGTDVDDLVVLTTLFAIAERGGPTRRQIVVGQYAGITTLVLISAIVALGLLVVPERLIGLLGLVPIALGIRGLVATLRSRRAGDDEAALAPVQGTLGVAGVTIANGADNISVYTPLFRQAGASGLAVYVVVFAVLIAVWCALGWLLAGQTIVSSILDRIGHILVPCVFVLIGALIIVESGLLSG
jgi:cadmium resistance protein CadD (predicted permease)